MNVFDERELELLIGGIADIDVDDWKKHTDYRGYTESDEVIVNFWKVSHLSLSSRVSKSDIISSVFEVGTRSRSPDCCSLRRALPVSPSMDSKTYRAVMVPEDLLLRRQESLINYPSHIPGMLFPS